jgi:hypothetical protein
MIYILVNHGRELVPELVKERAIIRAAEDEAHATRTRARTRTTEPSVPQSCMDLPFDSQSDQASTALDEGAREIETALDEEALDIDYSGSGSYRQLAQNNVNNPEFFLKKSLRDILSELNSEGYTYRVSRCETIIRQGAFSLSQPQLPD